MTQTVTKQYFRSVLSQFGVAAVIVLGITTVLCSIAKDFGYFFPALLGMYSDIAKHALLLLLGRTISGEYFHIIRGCSILLRVLITLIVATISIKFPKWIALVIEGVITILGFVIYLIAGMQ